MEMLTLEQRNGSVTRQLTGPDKEPATALQRLHLEKPCHEHGFTYEEINLLGVVIDKDRYKATIVA
jgi:hypothetical protein